MGGPVAAGAGELGTDEADRNKLREVCNKKFEWGMLLDFKTRNVIKTVFKKELWAQNVIADKSGFWAPPSGRAGTPRDRGSGTGGTRRRTQKMIKEVVKILRKGKAAG